MKAMASSKGSWEVSGGLLLGFHELSGLFMRQRLSLDSSGIQCKRWEISVGPAGEPSPISVVSSLIIRLLCWVFFPERRSKLLAADIETLETIIKE